MYDMVTQITAIFGEKWKIQNLIIGVTKWGYSDNAVKTREKKCKENLEKMVEPCHDEAWFEGEVKMHLWEKFKIEDVPIFFIDAFSQSGETNKNDEKQQKMWQDATSNLIEIAKTKPKFYFKVIDSICSNFRCWNHVQGCILCWNYVQGWITSI